MLLEELHLKQEIVGCFGFPVPENARQAIIEPAFRAVGLDWRYLTFEVRPKNLAAAVEGAKAFGFHGFNCAIPHKVTVIPHLDALGKSASLAGAVNCVVNRGGQLFGENTEGAGFVASIRELTDPREKALVILGDGAAARAIGVEMALAGCGKITVVTHEEKRGRQLEALFAGALREAVREAEHDLAVSYAPFRKDFQVPDDTEILVDTTPIGLFPNVNEYLPIAMEMVSDDTIVADVIPNPPGTRVVWEARERGCRVIDGLTMLAHQGMINVEHWTGRTPDLALMRRALLEAMHISSEHRQFAYHEGGRQELLEGGPKVL
jgi:shikimate dehydrogenase